MQAINLNFHIKGRELNKLINFKFKFKEKYVGTSLKRRETVIFLLSLLSFGYTSLHCRTFHLNSRGTYHD
jgi:hypothetical protein